MDLLTYKKDTGQIVSYARVQDPTFQLKTDNEILDITGFKDLQKIIAFPQDYKIVKDTVVEKTPEEKAATVTTPSPIIPINPLEEKMKALEKRIVTLEQQVAKLQSPPVKK